LLTVFPRISGSLSWRLIVYWALEEKYVWLRLVHLIMLPSQTLCDTQSAPFLLPEKLQCAFRRVEVVARNSF